MLATHSVANCGAAVCLINTNWDVQGAWTEPGVRVDARFDDVKQDRLQAGRRRVGIDAVDDDVIPVLTRDRNLIVSLDYAFNERWSVALTLPFIRRTHEQLLRIEPESDGAAPRDARFTALKEDETPALQRETLRYERFGDARLLARYAWLAEVDPQRGARTIGAQFGVKLPTGEHSLAFPSGERAEPGLQPGSGTTDALLGAFYRAQPIEGPWSWFAQGTWQIALQRKDDFKPGQKLRADAGVRYALNDHAVLHLQANALIAAKDSGARIDPADTGGRLLALSPGVSIALGKSAQAYAFYQRPVYQYVNGVQLATKSSFALGVSGRF